MKIVGLKDLKEYPDLAKSLGNMVIAWAYAENVLIEAMARISNMSLHMSQYSYYRIPTFESRVKFIHSLLEEWNPNNFDKDLIGKAITSLSKLSSSRNQWVHGDWCEIVEPKKEAVIFNHRLPPGSPDRRKPVKAADVDNHCEAVLSRSLALRILIDINTLRLDDD